MRQYIIEKEGQIDFFKTFRIDYENNNVLIEDTDGVWNGNLLEFKLNINDVSKTLFQAIKYLSKMRLNQWKNYTWKDTEALNDPETNEEISEAEAKDFKESVELVKEQYERGEINEAQYKTLMIADDLYKEELNNIRPGNDDLGADNPYNEKYFIDESLLPDPGAELTEEDKIYLAMKWGRTYSPNDWIQLETDYNSMKESFDIQDADSEKSLMFLCKTNLKANQAIDAGDLDSFQKLTRAAETLRKTAKFTAAQNKEKKEEFADSVGKLIYYCEKWGGQIPRIDMSIDRDILDTVIRDLKAYNATLIKEDTALAQQIEDYIKKREINENIKRDQKEARNRGLDYVVLEDADHEKYYEEIEKQIKEDQKNLYEGVEDQ